MCTIVQLCSSQILDEDTNAQDLIKAIKLFMAKYVGGTIQGNENYKKLMYSIQGLAQIINPKIILNQLEVVCAPNINFNELKDLVTNEKFSINSVPIERLMEMYFVVVIDGVFIGKIQFIDKWLAIKPPKPTKLNIYYDTETICYIKTEPRIYEGSIQYKLSKDFDNKDILSPNPVPEECIQVVKLFREGLFHFIK